MELKLSIRDAGRGILGALRRVIAHRRRPRRLLQLVTRKLSRLRDGESVPVLLREMAERDRRRKEYDLWIANFDTLGADDIATIEARVVEMEHKPLLSIVMPVFNPDIPWLEQAIESVRAQLYPNWELCVADDCSTAPGVRSTLERFEALDSRIHVVYRATNGHISAASNSALELATGEYIALLDHDDVLPRHALYVVATEIGDADLVYSDEDKIDENGARFDPYFKPDWNPDLFLSHNLVSHLGVYRTALVREVGGFREGFEGSQDWDLALRVVEKTDRIRHIPRILYHWRAVEGSTAEGPDSKAYAYDAASRAINEHLIRLAVNAHVVRTGETNSAFRVRYELVEHPRVSIIILTRDRAELLERCLHSLWNRTDYPDYQILVVDNGSIETATHALFERHAERISVVRDDSPFNFSALNNRAVALTDGSVLAFLNNDTEVISPDWLTEMVSHALRPEVGAVGAMLYYADDTIQHAGIILGMGGVAAHAHRGLARGRPGTIGRAALLQSFSAVTAACMVMRRVVFNEVSGFDEELPLAYNDVDLCLRLRERGYRVIWTPYAELYHHESASRGSDQNGERRERLVRDTAIMRKRWGETLLNDPAYNPNLAFDRVDFRPASAPRTRPICSLANP